MNEWAAFLAEVLCLPKVPYIGLVGHWYRGDVSTDAFILGGRVSHAVTDLHDGHLGILEKDVIHEFRLDRTVAA